MQDYQQGNNPTNYYSQNGELITPTITKITGDQQPGGPGITLPQPLEVQVTNNGAPLVNAPVTFTVSTGGGGIALTGLGATSSSVSTTTNSQGEAEVYFTVNTDGTNQVSVTAGTATLATPFNEAPPLASEIPPSGNNSQGGASAPPGAYGVSPSAGPVPFNAYTGNMSRVVDDLSDPALGETGLDWKRYFHSRTTNGTAYFDSGGIWRHSYQWDFAFVTVNGQQDIEVVYPDATTNLFAFDSTSNVYRSTIAVDDVIVETSTNNYQLIRANNQTYNFTTTTVNGATIYYLASIFDSKGNQTTMTWGHPVYQGTTYTNNWTLNKITEPGGNSLTISYVPYSTGVSTAQLLLGEVETQDGRTVIYSYGTTTQSGTTYLYLAQAAYSDTTKATYQYILPTDAPNGVAIYPELSQALDVRAEGPEQIDMNYYDIGTTGASLGTLLYVEDDSTQNVLEVVNLTVNAQTAIVGYQTNGYGIFTAYTYNIDSQGRVTTLTDSDPNYNVNVMDKYAYTSGSGTVSTASTDGNGNVVTTVTTNGGQMLSRTYPKVGSEANAPTETWGYTTDSNHFTYLSSYQDTRGYTTKYFYTANYGTDQPQLLQSIQYADTTTKGYGYDNFGRLTSITDELTHQTKYSYDSLNRMLTATDPLNKSPG